MIKSLGILIGGIFIGAVGAEVARKKYPDALNKLCARTREIASEVKESFRDGYKNAMHPQEAVKASA
jgi:hypothetical protein